MKSYVFQSCVKFTLTRLTGCFVPIFYFYCEHVLLVYIVKISWIFKSFRNQSFFQLLCRESGPLLQVFYFFLLDQNCEDWTAVEDSSQWVFSAYNSPFCIRGAVMGFLNAPKLGKSITEETQEAIPFTLPPTNLLISLLPVS